MKQSDESGKAFSRLCDIMKQLRGPDGCPWDAEQTPETLKDYIVEETYELLEAIDEGDSDQIRDELGDLLLQVVFQSAIFSERGCFDPADVANAISDKLVRRHPHVFADAAFSDEADLHRQWDAIKRSERKKRNHSASALAGIPKSLPALQHTQKLMVRASRCGLPLENQYQSRREIAEQLTEIDQADTEPDRDSLQLQIGNLLLAIVSLAHASGISAEDSLRQANRRFTETFEEIERRASEQNRDINDLLVEGQEVFWNRAKKDDFSK
ncbi:MAG: nucleoside triphosphate pyrophosphohydrolase [Desulfuromonas sp.]|nr:MAG: nucleoside triphosphate pyrophosphohydrolase [Desulfuromonas sp.]